MVMIESLVQVFFWKNKCFTDILIYRYSLFLFMQDAEHFFHSFQNYLPYVFNFRKNIEILPPLVTNVC